MDGHLPLAQCAIQSQGPIVLNDLLMCTHVCNVTTLCASRKHKLSLDGRPASPQFALMHVGERIRKHRLAAGWSQTKLGSAVHQAQTTISSWEVGRTEPTRDDVARVAKALNIDRSELESISPGDGEPGDIGYPLIGKVGAGGEGLYADDYELGAALERIEPLPGMSVEADVIALEADGDSMAPLVFSGDLAFFGPIRHDVDELLNQRVMARLADGRKFFKILKRGSAKGLYTLRSLNPATPDIEDVAVSWVLPYQGSRPRRR